MNSTKEKLNKIIAWENAKPVTDNEWAEDVKQESLNVKFDKQLAQMKSSLQTKLPIVEDGLKWITKYPDYKRKELDEEISSTPDFDLEGKTKAQFMQDAITEQVDYLNWKIEKIKQSVERIEKEQDLRKRKVVIRKPIGTTYYMDADNGNNANDGLTTGTAWKTLEKFTEAARSAGDIVILRRGTVARYDDGTILEFTSDGLIENPIIIEADYDDVFGDDTNSVQTYTPIFGSKTMEASATITGISVGDWIYVTGDNQREFTYEVAAVSGTTLTLFLPFKGSTGAGKTLVIMKSIPSFGTPTGTIFWNFNIDNFWISQGMHLAGTSSNAVVNIGNSMRNMFKDMVFESNGLSDSAIRMNNAPTNLKVFKSRFFNYDNALKGSGDGTAYSGAHFKDCLFDGNNIGGSSAMILRLNDHPIFEDCELKGHLGGDFDFTFLTFPQNTLSLRNVILGSAVNFQNHHNEPINNLFTEDFDGIPSDTRHFSDLSTAEDTPVIQSEITTVRVGGSNKSIKVTPSTKLANVWEHSRLLLFEIALYATTVSKTYTVYFNLPTAGFTTAPVVSELWIELGAWGHATNNHRKVTKSIGTIIADGTWRSLTFTIAPLQTGVAYLKCYYAKTKEGGKDNIFYVDPLPEIT